jgi:hypothetical protein
VWWLWLINALCDRICLSSDSDFEFIPVSSKNCL